MHRIVNIEAGAVRARFRRPAFAHEWVDFEATAQGDVADRLVDATIAIVNKRRLTADLIAALPALQMVAVAATGYNNIDLDACRARGIVVSNVRGYARETVPEHVFALLLALIRQIGPYHRSVAAGRWQQSEQFCYFDYPIRDLAGRKLGLLGSGTLGQGVARIAEAFGMTVLRGEHKSAAGLREGYVPFERLIGEADVISLHCPLFPETKGIVNAASIAKMKDGVILLNNSRGPLIVEQDLADALASGKVFAAGLDVVSEEPIRADNPLLLAKNCIITPHISWAPKESRQRLMDAAASNLAAWVAGKAVNVVNP